MEQSTSQESPEESTYWTNPRLGTCALPRVSQSNTLEPTKGSGTVKALHTQSLTSQTAWFNKGLHVRSHDFNVAIPFNMGESSKLSKS